MATRLGNRGVSSKTQNPHAMKSNDLADQYITGRRRDRNRILSAVKKKIFHHRISFFNKISFFGFLSEEEQDKINRSTDARVEKAKIVLQCVQRCMRTHQQRVSMKELDSALNMLLDRNKITNERYEQLQTKKMEVYELL